MWLCCLHTSLQAPEERLGNVLELGGHSWPDPRTSTTSSPCLLTPHPGSRPGPRQDFRDLLPPHLSTCGLGRRGPQRPLSPSWSSSWPTGLWSLHLCYPLPALAHPLFGRRFLKSCSCSVLGSCIRPSSASPFAVSSGAPTGLGRSLLIAHAPHALISYAFVVCCGPCAPKPGISRRSYGATWRGKPKGQDCGPCGR